MSYWKGLMLAAVLDAVWISGCPSRVTDPTQSPAAHFRAVDEPVQHLLEIDARIDALMTRLQVHPTDVAVMAKLARLYADAGWYEQALGPLARALQLEPGRRGLWVALDDVLERSGRDRITDAELVRLGAEFEEQVRYWGHGC